MNEVEVWRGSGAGGRRRRVFAQKLDANVAAAAAAAVPISTRRGYVVWARPRETLLDPLLMWVMAWTVRAMA